MKIAKKKKKKISNLSLEPNAFFELDCHGAIFNGGTLWSTFVRCDFSAAKFNGTACGPGTRFVECDFRESNYKDIHGVKSAVFEKCVFEEEGTVDV